jgi:hypothetical protein
MNGLEVDIQVLVEESLRNHKDPHIEVARILNKWCSDHKEEGDWDRDSSKLFVTGFLAGRGLEIDGENHCLVSEGTSWNREHPEDKI